jgi:hypothetical protein
MVATVKTATKITDQPLSRMRDVRLPNQAKKTITTPATSPPAVATEVFGSGRRHGIVWA